MTHSVERRAEENLTADHGDPRDDVLEPFLRSDASRVAAEEAAKESAGSASGDSVSTARPANLGLTRRERKVKDLLLRELKKSSDIQMLSYEEIQNIEKTLNVKWIDEQLDTMKKLHRKTPWLYALYSGILLFYVMTGLGVLDNAVEGGLFSVRAAFAVVIAAAALLAPHFARRALRRRIFIFEALRELSGADEAGVTLDQAVKDADALITRIVDRELAGEAVKPAKTIGRHRTN